MKVDRRGGIFRLAVIVCVAAFSCAARAQTTEGMRTWSDSSGRYKTEAAFMRLDADTVYLKTADGRMISLPLTRLSEKDRDHVAQLLDDAAPPTSPDTGVLPRLRAASVIVWWEKGERVFPTPGIVVLKKGERSYVVVNGTKPARSDYSKEPESFSIAVDDEASRVPAERIGLCTNGTMTILTAPADRLPDPLPPVADTIPVAGQPATVIGWYVKYTGSSAAVEHVEQPVGIHRVFHTADGTFSSFRIEAPPPVPTFGLVADEEGQFVGVVMNEVRFTSSIRSQDEPIPPRFYTVEPAAAFVDQLLQPGTAGLYYTTIDVGTDNRTLQFVAALADPFEQVHNPRVRIQIRTRASISDKVPYDEDDPRLMLADIEPLRLDRRRPNEGLLIAEAASILLDRHTTWVADITLPFDKDHGHQIYRVQFVYETPDGKTHAGNPESLFESRRP